MRSIKWVFVVGILASSGEAGPIPEEAEPSRRRIVIEFGTPAEEGSEGSLERSFVFSADPGHVFLYLEAGATPSVLSVTDPSGTRHDKVATRSGCSTLISFVVTKKAPLHVTVASRENTGSAVLVLSSSRETKETHHYVGRVCKWLAAEKERSSHEARNRALSEAKGFLRELERLPGRDRSWHVSHVLLRLGAFLRGLGDVQGNAKALEASYRIMKDLKPDDDEEFAVVRVNLAQARYGLADYRGALTLLEEVIASCGARAAASEPGSSIRDVLRTASEARGASLNALGRLTEAREAFEHSLEKLDAGGLQERDFEILGNLALTIKELGDRDGARALEERLLAHASAQFDDDHPMLTWTRCLLADSLRGKGDFAWARALAEKVVSIRERTLPPGHLDLQRAHRLLAAILRDLGDLEGAYDLEKAILDACNKREQHGSWVLDAKLRMASTLSRMGRLEEAAELEWEVIEGEMKRAGGDVPYGIRHLLHRRIWGESREGKHEDAVEATRKLITCLTKKTRERAAKLSIRENEAAADLDRELIDGILSWTGARKGAEPVSELDDEVFSLIETYRGVSLFGSLGAPKAGAGLTDSGRKLREWTERFVELGRRGVSKGTLSTEALQKERLERVERMEASGGATPLSEMNPEEALRFLGKKEAAICFWTYRRYGFQVDDPGEEHLLALVLRPGSRVHRFELGSVAEMERVIREWRRAAGAGDLVRGRGVAALEPYPNDFRRRGDRLRRLVFDPLREALGDAETLLVALDDVLWSLSLECLPTEDGLLGDEFAVYVVSSLGLLPTRKSKGTRELSFLGVGGVDYSAGDPSGQSVLPVEGDRPTSFPRFKGLKNTSAEVSGIREFFTRVKGSEEKIRILRGREASKENLFSYAPGVSYLHIATHGYFDPGSIPSVREDPLVDSHLGLYSSSDLRNEVRSFAPLTFCGLALAGANRASEGDWRGILTAEELRTVDLRECRLVVLSACETSVGVNRPGQGLQSLQKALHSAGVRLAVTSLWPVPDEATRELMVSFYEGFLVEGLEIERALWRARMEIKRRYGPGAWAGWIVSGVPE